jgi:hypothetical protein
MVVLLSLMVGPLMAQEPEVTPLMSKELTDFPGKEVFMITVEYPPSGSDPIHRHDAHGFIIRCRKPRPLGVVRDKRLCLTKVHGPKHRIIIWARRAPVEIEAERAVFAAFIS